MRYMEPTSQEIRMRKDLVQGFTRLITFDMNACIRPVGSYVTGLYLPTSDIDMAITFSLQTEIRLGGYSSRSSRSSRLYMLIGKIPDSGFSDNVLQASVPLIRITDKITGIQIDLTESDTHAVKATTKAVQEWLQHSSPAKPHLFVVRMFLSN